LTSSGRVVALRRLRPVYLMDDLHTLGEMFGPDVRCYLGIDPGPRTSGVVFYVANIKTGAGLAAWASSKATLEEVRHCIDSVGDDATVVIEQTHPGPPSWSVINTTMVVGRLLEYTELRGIGPVAVMRGEVKSLLGRSDTAIRHSIIKRHLYDPATFHHTHNTTLKGVTGHAWQALAAVLYVHNQRHPEQEETP